MKLVGNFLLTIQIAELILYAIIYSFVLNHNRSMLDSTVITRETYKNRQRCHIYSLASQMAHSAVEMFYSFSLNLVITNTSLDIYIFELAAAFKILSFGILSTVQIFASLDLRLKLFYLINKFKP